MPVVSMQSILADAFAHRYGVAAFNVFNDLTLDAVLEAAAQTNSPVIVQVSVKTVKQIGAGLLQLMFAELANRRPIPATLHLDHCPDFAVAQACLEAGWNSVLFDASNLSYDENVRQTTEMVTLAHRYGAAVEGELEPVKGVEDDHGSDEEGAIVTLEQAVQFMRLTGIDSFAPAIGTAHGVYTSAPTINYARVAEIVAAQPLPIVLHGGTGLSDTQFQQLIALGCAKVNISTALKITYADSYRTYLSAHPSEYNPLKLLDAVRADVVAMAKSYMQIFGSVGRAAGPTRGSSIAMVFSPIPSSTPTCLLLTRCGVNSM
ncbi:class II fructose-bisphosphate aldolase [Candidatus Gracilibacteria bacterium]|nr:class II fructose-bisphosphate aldolase [Candidatus Gracilibacteria bacterium]